MGLLATKRQSLKELSNGEFMNVSKVARDVLGELVKIKAIGMKELPEGSQRRFMGTVLELEKKLRDVMAL